MWILGVGKLMFYISGTEGMIPESDSQPKPKDQKQTSNIDLYCDIRIRTRILFLMRNLAICLRCTPWYCVFLKFINTKLFSPCLFETCSRHERLGSFATFIHRTKSSYEARSNSNRPLKSLAAMEEY